MGRRNRLTGRDSDGAKMDAFVAKLSLIAMAIAFIVGGFYIFLSNVFSASTASDFGRDVWTSNISGFHVDSVMQSDIDLKVFEKSDLDLYPDNYFTYIPRGALFKHRGTVRLEHVHWLAVEFYYQTERKIGFILLELRRTRDHNTGKDRILPYEGIREIRYPNKSYPRQNNFVRFDAVETDRNVADSLRRSLVDEIIESDLHKYLDINYASTPIDRERVLSGQRYLKIDFLSNDNVIAYIDNNEAKKYREIISAFDDAAYQMLIYQIDPSFDALEYIRSKYKN